MNIPDTAVWDKTGWPPGAGKGVVAAGIAALLLFGALCFWVGQKAAEENRPADDALWIEQLPEDELPAERAAGQSVPATTDSAASDASAPVVPATAVSAAGSAEGTYVASKSGTKYYLPSCASAKRIKDENKVWFATEAAAAAAGYAPAANCEGL